MQQQREEAAQTEQDLYQQSYRQQPYQQTSPYAPQTGNRYLPSAEQLAYKRQVLQPMRATVRGRVSFYTRRTRSWQELEQDREKFPDRTPEQSRKLISCQSKVSALYEAYTVLQLQLFDDRNLTDSREQIMMSLQNLQNRDFTYLAGECPSLFKQLSAQSSAQPERIVPSEEAANPTMPDPMTTGNDVFQPEQPDFSTPDVNQPDINPPDIKNYPQNSTQYGQYGQPVNSPPTDLFSPAEPPPNYEERYQQAQSLLKQGREQDARRILSDLLASARQTGNRTLQIKILKKISELELALRNYLPARILYEELQQLNAPFDKQHLAALQSIDSQREKVDAYAALLLSAMRSNPERDGFTVVQQARAFVQNFPDSPLRSNVENLEAKVELEAEQWFQGLLRQFDRLAANQQHQEALALLEHVPLDILPLDKQDIIQQRKDSLTILTMPSPPVQADFPPSPTTAFPDVSVTGNIRQEVRNQQNTDQLNQLNQLKAVNQVQPAAMTQNVRQEVQEQPNTDQLNQLKTVNQVQPAAMTQNVRQEVRNQPNTDQLNQLKTVNQVQARQPAQQPVQPAEPSVPKETKRSETKRLPGNKEKFSGSSQRPADMVVQKKWNQAEAAFRAAEYDKAITLYTALLNTSLDTQARRKMEKASLAAGQEARRKAANFFQRANSATDPETRKQHLLSSKMLLEDILQKYPLAGLDTKVKRNLSRVDKELSALDHTPFE
jgi:hypothetical protein